MNSPEPIDCLDIAGLIESGATVQIDEGTVTAADTIGNLILLDVRVHPEDEETVVLWAEPHMWVMAEVSR